MTSWAAYTAMNRFGLGPSSKDIVSMADDPREWLLSQIDPASAMPEDLAEEPSAAELISEELSPKAAKIGGNIRQSEAQRFEHAMRRRVAVQVRSPYPFAERLVLFWSNHFTVSRTNRVAGVAVTSYEVEAIRPHIFDRFEDLLIACCQHPAMLIYLDNNVSVGPNSPSGQRSGRGLNENLAREILELHTLGARGGYRQEDVTALAAALTGWSVARDRHVAEKRGRDLGDFVFRDAQHEPGAQTIIGRTYAQDGQAQGEAILRRLAALPATARHIATCLARHFIADDPPLKAVIALEDAYLRSGGNLAEVSRALIELDMAWSAPPTKVRRPYDLMIALLRASPELQSERGLAGDALPPPELFLPALEDMGQPAFRPISPAGWSDRAEDWIGPASLTQRVRWIDAIVEALGLKSDPARLIDEWLSPIATPAFRNLVSDAPSRDDGLSLLFASPQFQRY